MANRLLSERHQHLELHAGSLEVAGDMATCQNLTVAQERLHGPEHTPYAFRAMQLLHLHPPLQPACMQLEADADVKTKAACEQVGVGAC